VKRAALLLALFAGLATLSPASGFAQEWRSQQPRLAAGGTTAAPLGEVGDIECWQANRCLLITGGNGGMPEGLYAYDGTGWYLYSTVCGGGRGRIAWAGPTEFWTVSDQQLGQETLEKDSKLEAISLCHFKDSAVVASYAQPLGVAGSYLRMQGAACLSPDECWFAGERLPGTVNVGAFHLYWNGISVSPIPSLTEPQPELEDPGRTVVGLAYHHGRLYEGVQVQDGDQAEGEPTDQPRFLHRILPGTVPAFVPEIPAGPIEYGGAGATPERLEGFQLSSGDDGLWAVSGTTGAPNEVTVLRLGSGGFEQVSLEDPTPAFEPGDSVTGLAAEPGAGAAWIGFRHATGDRVVRSTRLARVHADGTVEPPLELRPEGEISPKGWTGPIECPAAGQCWMATEQGWLYHLGEDPPKDHEPAMHALVTFRPRDASLPDVPPVSLPVDDSGEYQALEIPLSEGLLEPIVRRRPAIYFKLQQRLLGRRVLQLAFNLRQRARVQLRALRSGRVVAKTRPRIMGTGRHRLRLRLHPLRWPTRIDLRVRAAGGRGT
jgi:hypothetical protein